MHHQVRTLSVPEEMRLFAGLVVQPFIAGGLAFFLFPLLWLDSNGRSLAGGSPTDAVAAAESVAIGAGLLAFVITLVAALPTAVWLTKRKFISFAEALLWGLGFGNTPMAIGTVLAGTYGVAGVVRGVAFSSVLSIAGAAMFWAIALRRQRKPNAVA
jgi:hypothetical protein